MPAFAAVPDIDQLRALGERWWQWRVALPEIAAPAHDPLGRYCDNGQTGDVWFLAGFLSFHKASAGIVRSCIVPRGKQIFFPVSTYVNFPPKGGDASLCDREKRAVSARVDAATDLAVELDGRTLPGAELHRAGSVACFTLRGAHLANAAFPTAADGYWVLLDAPAPGHHRLTYRAAYKAGSPDAGQYQNVTYELDVR